jgi:hypothetical protein
VQLVEVQFTVEKKALPQLRQGGRLNPQSWSISSLLRDRYLTLNDILRFPETQSFRRYLSNHGFLPQFLIVQFLLFNTDIVLLLLLSRSCTGKSFADNSLVVCLHQIWLQHLPLLLSRSPLRYPISSHNSSITFVRLGTTVELRPQIRYRSLQDQTFEIVHPLFKLIRAARSTIC